MPTLRTVTLGCKVNQYETEFLREGLLRLGYDDVRDGEEADLCVVNTCTVTQTSDAKSRKIIRQLARQHPSAEIIVMGCYATRAAEEVAALPGVVEVIADKAQVPDWLARHGLVDIPTGISSFGKRHRAYVKIQDGCRMGCSYCIIPSVRPKLSSRPVREVLDEIRRLVEHGHREIVLTGIHLGHYGVGLDEPNFGLAPLLQRVVQIDGSFRIRISSLEASEATPDLLHLMADHAERICPHLHLSMQSGSDRVLRRMRRRWPAARFLERCEAIQETLDCPALTTDIIVGFPGEMAADFEASCRLAEAARFAKIHVFRFSPRRGTPAADMEDQIPEPVKQERAHTLEELGSQLRQRYFESLVGRTLQVLAETPSKSLSGMMLGTSARYAPVEFSGDSGLLGQLVTVKAESVVDARIQAKPA